MLSRVEEPGWFDINQLLGDITNAEIHTDDMWKKFDIDSLASEISNVENPLLELWDWNLDAPIQEINSEIRHHDCMWAGHCGSEEHKTEISKVPIIPPTVPMTQQAPKQTIVVKKAPTINATSSRSLLRTRTNQTIIEPQTVTIPLNVGPRPDSPPSSDDDDSPRFKHEIFKTVTKQTLFSGSFSEIEDDDSDLCEYFEDGIFTRYPGESDHSYHKGKQAQIRMDNLGVQTPSDSGKFIFFFTFC